MAEFHFLVSCEHAGNTVPPEFQSLFVKEPDVLETHEGLDIGGKMIAKHISNKLKAPLYYHEISRLLIEANRSLDNPDLFSRFSANLSVTDKNFLIEKYYLPYRQDVENKIREIILHVNHVIHLSVHTFTPELNGVKRDADIGLLYDPSIKDESDFCKEVEKSLKIYNPEIKLKHNYPYLGIDDGFVTYLREKFSNNYTGIELEINQKFPLTEKASLLSVMEGLSRALISGKSTLEKNYAK